MTRPELIDVIRNILTVELASPHLARFDERARLNEDLCLDSVMVLQLLVSLELQHGLVLPEEAMLEKQAGTVGSLAELLLQHRVTSAEPSPLLAAGGPP